MERGHSPEQGMMEVAGGKDREAMALYDRVRASFGDFESRAKQYLDDPHVTEGAKAAMRTVLNAGIAVGDLFPGWGLATSGVADAAKVAARAEYRAKRLYVRWIEKGNPDDVKMSKLDLTPDVGLSAALGSELLEFCAAGFLPTHAIEGGIQLYHDWPRMKKAVARMREIAASKAELPPRVQDAAAAFGVGGAV